MNLEDFAALVKRITYKPHVRLDCYTDMKQLRVSFYSEDAANIGGEKIHFSMSSTIPIWKDDELLFKNENEALHWILYRVDDAERHETREWLKLDGIAIFDPHKGTNT